MNFRLSAALIAVALACPALAAPPANFDQRVEQLRRGSETPGMAIAIVEQGKTVLVKGYGVRKLGGGEDCTDYLTVAAGSVQVHVSATLDASPTMSEPRTRERTHPPGTSDESHST